LTSTTVHHATVVIKVNFVMSIAVAMAMASAILPMKRAYVIKDTLLWQINAHSIVQMMIRDPSVSYVKLIVKMVTVYWALVDVGPDTQETLEGLAQLRLRRPTMALR
jgi:hypothetical protein